MKHIITALVISMPTMALADGLTEQGLRDPVVTPPAQDWTGPYAGLTYGRHETEKSETRCYKLGTEKDCNDPIFLVYPEYKEEVTTTSKTSSDETGVFAGYRHDFGLLVGGVEVSSLETAEVQMGVDAGRLLVYGYVGTDNGLGIDARIGRRVLVGVRSNGEDTLLRVGIEF